MHTFKVMSFNVDGSGTNREPTRRWGNRRALCVDILHRYNADIIGFQEVQAENRATLDKILTKHSSSYGVKSTHQEDEFASYNPIYWKPERFELLESGCFYLSQTPEKWSKDWDALHVRSATWVCLLCRQTNIPFIYMNFHLDHRGLRARIESSKLIICQAMQLSQPRNLSVILSGDFNERPWLPMNENVYEYPLPILPDFLPPGGSTHQIFTEQEFKDAYLEAGYMDQLAMNTYHDYHGDAFPPVALRIDWILIHNGKQQLDTHSFVCIKDAIPPFYASDHYPIMAELEWQIN